MLVDACLRLEDFPAALHTLAERIGLPAHLAASLQFPHANRIQKNPRALPPLPPDVRERIATRYEADFRAFGYPP